MDSRTNGAKLFTKICVACHGTFGEGITGLAPNLMNSKYVYEPLVRLGLILFHGLKGPLEINGNTYEVNGTMPGLLENESISDEDISDLIAYVTNAFSDNPKWIGKEKIAALRTMRAKDGGQYTEEELLSMSAEEK